MLKQDFYYEVPNNLIAQSPVDKRDLSRILICDASKKSIENSFFYELPNIIKEKFQLEKNQKKALLIANDSRVYPARVRIVRKTGARGEVFFLETGNKISYKCLLRPKSKLKIGEILYYDSLEDNINNKNLLPLFKVTNLEPPHVSLIPDSLLSTILDKYGEMPLPPYIDRDPLRVPNKNKIDSERYQTIYSDINKLGSSAAPTAGLHFTEETLIECKKIGIEFASVTLHVGLGTFSPVQVNKIEDHQMHEEYYCINNESLEKICEYLKNEWPIIYIGTTSLRTVESFFRKFFPPESQEKIKMLAKQNQLREICKSSVENWHATKLFIYPQDKEKRVRPCIGEAIITNFHQPESTLIMLISALMGYDFCKDFYQYAIDKKYRFFSYGDSSLLIF